MERKFSPKTDVFMLSMSQLCRLFKRQSLGSHPENLIYWVCMSFLLLSYKNYHKVSALKWHKFMILQFWRSQLCNESYGLKSRCQLCSIPSGDSKEEPISLPFPESTRHLLSLDLGPFFHLEKPLFHSYISWRLSLVRTLWLHWVYSDNQGQSSRLSILKLIITECPFCHVK